MFHRIANDMNTQFTAPKDVKDFKNILGSQLLNVPEKGISSVQSIQMSLIWQAGTLVWMRVIKNSGFFSILSSMLIIWSGATG